MDSCNYRTGILVRKLNVGEKRGFYEIRSIGSFLHTLPTCNRQRLHGRFEESVGINGVKFIGGVNRAVESTSTRELFYREHSDKQSSDARDQPHKSIELQSSSGRSGVDQNRLFRKYFRIRRTSVGFVSPKWWRIGSYVGKPNEPIVS